MLYYRSLLASSWSQAIKTLIQKNQLEAEVIEQTSAQSMRNATLIKLRGAGIFADNQYFEGGPLSEVLRHSVCTHRIRECDSVCEPIL